MDEHTFGHEPDHELRGSDGTFDGRRYDYGEMLDELRCHTTESVECRWPGCDQRVGLEVHHLWPRSWGGSDEIWNLAAVCWHHHHQFAPQGPWLLLGNPNHPAGLSLITRDDLPKLATLAAEHARAGPDAA